MMFNVMEAVSDNKMYMVNVDTEHFLQYFKKPPASYGIIKCRLFGLNYKDYCTLMKEKCGAFVRGEGKYKSIIFQNKENADKVCEILNKKWEKIKRDSF